jgi:hypothetical protein
MRFYEIQPEPDDAQRVWINLDLVSQVIYQTEPAPSLTLLCGNEDLGVEVTDLDQVEEVALALGITLATKAREPAQVLSSRAF